jgi:hypothetical protein
MYQERERYEICSWVVRLLGNKFYPQIPECKVIIKPTWIPPLLDFLSLNEKLCPAMAPAGSLPPPGLIALRILSDSNPPFADLCAAISPQLTSALSLTHPQQLRDLALTVFPNVIPGWFSPQMKDVVTEDLNKLLRAIGDPFQVTQTPFQEGEPGGIANADPMLTMQILIQFASLDLWRDHLRRSNFDTYEDMMSLENQKKGALWSMLCTTTF